MGTSHSSVAENVAAIQERVDRAAARAGRKASDVTIVGISKTFPAERIREAFELGVRHFGGHLQRNKAARAIGLFHTIDSLDSLPLAEKLNKAAGEGRRLPVLIEVRLDSAVTKSGCDPAELSRLAEGVLLMPRLELRGLMTVPELTSDPHEVRPFFRRLHEIRDRLSRQLDWLLPELSMGMSRDFDIAIEEGATQIRLGTALFGTRQTK